VRWPPRQWDPRRWAPWDSRLRRWLPRRLRGERDLPTWIALAVAFILTIQPARAGAGALMTVAVLFATVVAARRWRLGWLAILILLGVGIALRLGAFEYTVSDVLDVTGDALRRALLGQGPWGHGFDVSRPTGAPFPYGPLALFWYLPAIGDPRQLELFVSCAILGLLAVRGRPVGLAVYATAPTLILTATDGSNDTSAGLLILLAFVLAARRPWLGAVALAAAVAFKPYAAAWAPGLLLYGGLPALAAFALASLALWLPSTLSWGLGNYLTSLRMADATHTSTYWSVGVVYEQIAGRSAPQETLNRLRLIFGAATLVYGLRLARSLDGVLLAGTLVFAVVMFGGYWGSYAYLAAIAPIACWRLDDWLRIPAPEIVATAPWAPTPADAPGVSSPR
jgi:hypothetical protein